MDNIIRHARKALGLTQKQLARIMGVNQVTICGWEQGRGEPRISQWWRLEAEAKRRRVPPNKFINEQHRRAMIAPVREDSK